VRTINELIASGVTFDNVRGALAYMYFGVDGMTQEYWQRALAHVLPMQHNIENPIQTGKAEGWTAKDTFIEYWIDDDDRITQDKSSVRRFAAPSAEGATEYDGSNSCLKVARITVRFMGADAEAWAKLFHHVTMRPAAAAAWVEYCGAVAFEYIGPIRPINVDYFGGRNTAVAYDIVFMLQYEEIIKIPSGVLGQISIADGDIALR
jgi:hypothetical protein